MSDDESTNPNITMTQISRILAKYLEDSITHEAIKRYTAIKSLYDVLCQFNFEPNGDERKYEIIKIKIDNSEELAISLIVSMQIDGTDLVSKVTIRDKTTPENNQQLSITVLIEENKHNVLNISNKRIIDIVKDDVLQKMADIKYDAELRTEDTWKSIGIDTVEGRSLNDLTEDVVKEILEKIKKEHGDIGEEGENEEGGDTEEGNDVEKN